MPFKRLQSILAPVMVLLIGVAAMELIARSGWIKPYLLPAPSAVARALGRDGKELVQATLQTGGRAGAGFAASALGGLAIGVLLSSSRFVERAFYPYAVFFQTVPVIAIAPLLVIWFGYGTPTVVASAFIVSIFPVIAGTLAGLHSADPALIDLFRMYRAGWMATLFKMKLPGALPSILTGLRVAAGLAVIGAIVGEFIGGGGLGAVLDESRTQQRTDKLFAALLLASALGLALFALVNLLSWLLLRGWHASEQRSR